MEIDHGRQIVLALRRITQAIDVYSSQLWQEHGLTATQLGTLREIERGHVTPSALAACMRVSGASVAGVLKRLESRKLIARIRDPNDGRSFQMQVTAEGAQLCCQAPQLLRDHFLQELAKIDAWERTLIVSTLDRIATMMGAGIGDDQPFLGADRTGRVRKVARSQTPAEQNGAPHHAPKGALHGSTRA